LAGDYPQRWEYFKKDKLNLSIISKNFTNDPFAKLDVQIKNNSLSAIPNLEAEVVFYDKDGNAFASSVSKAGDVLGDSTQTISFAWPNPFPAVPELSEVYFRTDLTK
jgi:hypothetical protein